MSKVEKLAAAILADQKRSGAKRHDIVTCRACGQSHVNRTASDTCSSRCAKWLADGNPPYDPKPMATASDAPMEKWRIICGPPGCIDPTKPSFDNPFMTVCDQVMERQRNRRQSLGHEEDHRKLKAFMVAADIPFKSDKVEYLPSYTTAGRTYWWKSVLRRPAWSPMAEPSAQSDWRISGEWGSIFVNGDGYHLSIETQILGSGSFMEKAPTWAEAKRKLEFASKRDPLNPGAGEREGCLYLDRLPTPKEAVAICSVLGISRNRNTAKGEKTASAETV